MPSHNPTVAVSPGIPPAENHCSRVQHTRRSRGHKSSISGEDGLMSPERRQNRPLMCAHSTCLAPTSLLDRVLLPLSLKKKSTPSEELCHARRRHGLHAEHRSYALRDGAPVHFEYTTLPMWLKKRHPSQPPTRNCLHNCCHLVRSGCTRAADLHDHRRGGLHEPR